MQGVSKSQQAMSDCRHIHKAQCQRARMTAIANTRKLKWSGRRVPHTHAYLLGAPCSYVSGRKRKHNEVNGKSANLNNCFKNVIYAEYPRDSRGNIDWHAIGNEELLVVFDADMCAKQQFFLRLLEVMCDEQYALVLSPQAFHNISKDADLFNNINKQFWECWLPGAFAWGYIACTGTNFCLRARALAHCGWFPEYTITEDYALGMELKSRGYQATYLMMNLAEGEAPDEIRNVFRQRSRWNKGHFQVFFSSRCPLFNFGLPFFQRLWYSYAAWAPICAVVTLPVFIAVPFLSIVFGLNPVNITFPFVLGCTLNYLSMAVILHYSYAWGDWKSIWFANGSITVLWFTLFKALFNSLVAKLGMKVVAFKVTEKAKPQGGDAPPPAAARPASSILQRVVLAFTPKRLQRGRSVDHFAPNSAGPSMISSHALGAIPGTIPEDRSVHGQHNMLRPGTQPSTPTRGPFPRTASVTQQALTVGTPSKPLAPRKSCYVRGASPLLATESGKKSGWQRFKGVLASFKPAYIKDFDEMFDPLVLFGLFVFSAVTFALGVAQTAQSFSERNGTKLDFNSPMHGSPYLLIATLWALFNCITPYLFLHYCFTAEGTFKWAVRILMFVSHLLLGGSIIILWLLIPSEFSVRDPLTWQATQYLPAQVSPDTGRLFQFVQGQSGSVVTPHFNRTYLQELQAALGSAGGASARRLQQDPAASCLKVTPSLGRSLKVTPGSDPAALTDADLHALTPLAAWHRSLLQSASTAKQAYQGLPAGLDLSGGLLVRDHVKYGLPMAYTVTQLAWALLQFPKGFTPTETSAILKVVRSGSEYLIRCLMQTADGRYMFVAQVGDPKDYVVLPGMVEEQRPGKPAREWTSTSQDSYLTGKRPRKVWLLDEEHVGADLLANVAAALSATSLVMRIRDPAFSNLALTKAKLVYNFASIGQPVLKPHSYCEFVPCTSKVKVLQQQLTMPITAPPAKAGNEPECVYVDENVPTCKLLHTTWECESMLNSGARVFSSQAGCCSALRDSEEWKALKTKAQGICAVPFPYQKECYIPNIGEATCHNETIDAWTGVGCAGKETEIFATQDSCCTYMLANLPANSGGGKGICGDPSLDKAVCYVPDYGRLTCANLTGTACRMPGVKVYGLAESCCNEVADWAVKNGLQLQGACSAQLLGNSTLANTTQCYIPDYRNATCMLFTGSECTRGEAKRYGTELGCCNELIQWSIDNGYEPQGSCAQTAAERPVRPQWAIFNTSALTGRRRALKQASYPGQWRPTQTRPTGLESCAGQSSCQLRMVLQEVTVEHYLSTTCLDDLAWAAVWMYRASGDRTYLGESERYLERHQQDVIEPAALNSDRAYWVPSWKNLAWHTHLLLLKMTGSQYYEDKLQTLLSTWVLGRNVWRQGAPTAPIAGGRLQVTEAMDPVDKSKAYYVIPVCTPTEDHETSCGDGVDNDCDGLVDKEDTDCGVYPVIYSPKGLAAAGKRTLPNVATAAWLSMVYADTQEDASRARRLRCWALSQVSYMMGEAPGVQSYVVGYGTGPRMVQHRDSSCPAATARTGSPVCNWVNAFWPALPNPQLDLIRGGLLPGPNNKDEYVEDRAGQQSQVTLDGTAPLTSVLAGLLHTNTNLHTCQFSRGLYQRVFTDTDKL